MDDVGQFVDNYGLLECCVGVVWKYFIEWGVDVIWIIYQGYGESQFIVENDIVEGWW